MNVDWINGATQKELDQFKSVCNQLLSRTYLVKTLCRADKVRINNPDYLFLSSHYAEVREYLALLDWDLRKDDFNGYFYVINTDEANRCQLDKDQTAILLAIRMIYDENQERLGLEHDAICTVRSAGKGGNGLRNPFGTAQHEGREAGANPAGQPLCDSAD